MEITEEVKQALHVAKAIAKEFSNPSFGPEHLLKALLHKNVGLSRQLDSWGEDTSFIEEWAEVRIESYPKGKLTADPQGDAGFQQVVNEAEHISIKLGRDTVDALSLLASLSTPGVGFTYEQLKTFPLTQQSIVARVLDASATRRLLGQEEQPPKGNSAGSTSLLQYCRDLTQESMSGQAAVFVGREQELISIAEILCRKSKPNVLLSGDAGVGKTALVRGLATAIAQGNVPANLKAASVFELDQNALLAGATYKGEAEDRFRSLISSLCRFELPVLFIDDIHQLFDKSLGLQGIISIIKAELAKRSFTLIGTTLPDEFRKKLEPEGALMRWCEVLTITEPDTAQAAEIVQGATAPYADHHQVQVSPEVILEAVQLSKRYIKERRLPDAALDVLDRTMAGLQFMHNMAPQLAGDFTARLEALKESTTDAAAADAAPVDTADVTETATAAVAPATAVASGDTAAAYARLYQQLLNSLNYLTLSYLDLEAPEPQATVDASTLEGIIAKLRILDTPTEVQAEIGHIAATISKICGIPAGKILAGERERLINMEEQLQTKVIGQDGAVKVLTDAILESRSGLSRPGQPIGSFFFLGPTGTGKTELAKQLADFLFQSSDALIRFDMSEFKEEHSAALLYGAPPGYVGYEEGGLLVNKIRQQPYSVVLFDEIEKAHSSVFDIFLQILDEGKIHDKLGRVGDFSNAVVLFTSNIGSQFIVEAFTQKGVLPEQNELASIMGRHFRPEFLGRLSGIVPFAPIRKENVIKILKIQLNELEQSLASQDIQLEVTDAAADKLATDGYSPEYGARPLRSLIRTSLKTPLSRMLISGQLTAGNTVLADVDAAGAISLSCAQKELTNV